MLFKKGIIRKEIKMVKKIKDFEQSEYDFQTKNENQNQKNTPKIWLIDESEIIFKEQNERNKRIKNSIKSNFVQKSAKRTNKSPIKELLSSKYTFNNTRSKQKTLMNNESITKCDNKIKNDTQIKIDSMSSVKKPITFTDVEFINSEMKTKTIYNNYLFNHKFKLNNISKHDSSKYEFDDRENTAALGLLKLYYDNQ